MDPRLNDPGPTDRSLLVLQRQHRSQVVWDADVSYHVYVLMMSNLQFFFCFLIVVNLNLK